MNIVQYKPAMQTVMVIKSENNHNIRQIQEEKNIFKGNYLKLVEEFLVSFLMLKKNPKKNVRNVYKSKWHTFIIKWLYIYIYIYIYIFLFSF